MTTTTRLHIDRDDLLDARRELLRVALSLDEVRVHPADTGPTTSLTADALERVAAAVGSVVADLHGLADGLARLVDDLTDQDGRVSERFDLLTLRCVA